MRFDRINDDNIAAAFDAASQHLEDGHYAEALSLFDAIAAHSAHVAAVQTKRGTTLWAMRRFDGALAAYDQALALDPRDAAAHFGKGATLQSLQRMEEALHSYDATVALRPDHALAFNNRGVVLRELGRIPEAILSYDRAIALMPKAGDFHVGKALCTLLLGNLEAGWRAYEWRQQRILPVAPSAAPLWRGEALTGKTLLIQAEQGLGDTIQFCRFAPLAEALGGKVIFQVHDGLVRLMTGLSPTLTIAGERETPAYDYRIMLLSLPLLFKTTLSTIPATLPYLHAEPALVQTWKERLGGRGFKIGIGWQGERQWQGQRKAGDIGRSFPLNLYHGLSQIPGVRLISLQKNDGIEQLNALPDGMTVETFGADFDAGPDAFIDTAAVMENLDLVITSDTAVAHLAGALGRPTWVALKKVPDWRWLLERDDAPWYPGMRLFRQTVAGDWPSVFTRMETELRARVTAPR